MSSSTQTDFLPANYTNMLNNHLKLKMYHFQTNTSNNKNVKWLQKNSLLSPFPALEWHKAQVGKQSEVQKDRGKCLLKFSPYFKHNLQIQIPR